jgi:hypothetical protein
MAFPAEKLDEILSICPSKNGAMSLNSFLPGGWCLLEKVRTHFEQNPPLGASGWGGSRLLKFIFAHPRESPLGQRGYQDWLRVSPIHWSG